MGDCVFCGEPAGFLRKQHKECAAADAAAKRVAAEEARQAEARATEGANRIVQHVTALIHSEDPLENALSATDTITSEYQLSAERRQAALVAACENAVDDALEDGILTEQEERRIVRFMSLCDIGRDDLSNRSVWTKLVKMAVLRDVMNGLNPSRLDISDAPAVNFQKSESVIWAFPGCDYLEDRARIHYEGGSQGVSLRIMQGVYYRVGAFKGERISRTERVHVDTGWVFITNKHIYFAGQKKSVRVPYAKIVSFLPFSNGLGVMRDAQTAKPQIFVTDDGWFTYNLVTNLAAR